MIITESVSFWFMFINICYSLFGGMPYYIDCYDKAENINDTATCIVCNYPLDDCFESSYEMVDELIVWNSSLTEEEIIKIYEGD